LLVDVMDDWWVYKQDSKLADQSDVQMVAY